MTADEGAGPACKIQQICKLRPHRSEFAFGFNTPAKRPLERNKSNNKRDNKPEQVKEQARRSVQVKHQCEAPNKMPGGTIPAGRNSRVSISRIA